MLRFLTLLSILVSSLTAAPQLIPLPASMEIKKHTLKVPASIIYHCPEKFTSTLEVGLPQLKLSAAIKGKSFLKVTEDASLPHEGYTLDTTNDLIKITASSKTGVYYATQTLLQLMPPAVFATDKNIREITIPAVLIKDQPRFGWRGLMLDSSRHFQTIPEIHRFIDNLAHHKLNVFHWHLTDGHGWRFESKKYPKLTEIGAWRTQPGYPVKGKKEKYGGFYTQKEMREVVAYAKARGVTIVPEIDMPGHCFSFVAAYPECGCLRKPQGTDFLYTYPADAQRFPSKFGTDVLCVSQEKTLTMCKDILDEVMEIFPSKFIHIGGDEVNKNYWKNCKDCQAFIKKNKLHGEHGLQSWFIQQLDNHITSKRRRLIGWDEILEGGLAKNATVMSWQGEQGGIKAAKMGHDVVMSPQTYIYLDHGQSHSALEPPHWPGHKPLDRAYNYEPMPKQLSPKEAKHILGIQGNVWTVFTHEEWLIDICTWPRACAIAETGWSPKEKKNWDDFYQRLSQTHRKRLDYLGINYWWGNSANLGEWKPSQLKPNNEHVTLEYDVTDATKNLPAGKHPVTLTYTKGEHALSIISVALLVDGKVVSKEAHEGITGSEHRNNTYPLTFPTRTTGAKYTLRIIGHGSDGPDSSGRITISSVETKILKKLPYQDGYQLEE
ncbi:hypothetical protein NT6N_16560 [Oceaniferula spumae]|uniref:beta-N-acetylhexosaminidase n=1 Tax=Oceaniferula spumae TaxID=2979115 RepID=A0AAT9FL03_9BACT